MRTCNRCKQEKDRLDFPKNDHRNGNLATVCKECKNKRSKQLYNQDKKRVLEKMAKDRLENPEKYILKSRNRYENNVDKISIQRTKIRNDDPERFRSYWLKQKYGIDINDYNDLYLSQQGRCFLCGVHSSELNKPLCVDHSHETGKIRSLLCLSCNTGLGQFKENILVMEKAIQYLKTHR